MKVTFKIKALVAAASLAAAGSAFAQMTLNTSTGSIFLNIYDATNNDSYSFDTGLNQSTLGSSFSTSLTSDSNYNSFIAASKAGDTFEYDVVSINSGTNKVLYSTVNGTVTSTPLSGGVANAASFGNSLAGSLNAWNSSGTLTTNSAFVNVPTASANVVGSGFSSSWDTQLGISNLGLVGSALNFYSFSAPRGGQVSVSLFGSTWNLTSAGQLTYGAVSQVPLPPSVYLLLSGLGLMFVIARRKSASSEGSFPGAAA